MLRQTGHTGSSSLGDAPFLAPWPQDSTDLVWPVVRPLIERSFAATGYPATAALAYGWIMEGSAILWVCATGETIHGVVLTRIVFDAGQKHLEITVMAGRLPEGWQHLEGELIKHARACECATMRARARKGWSRRMRPYGWRPAWVLIEKAV